MKTKWNVLFNRRNEPICEADLDGEEEFYYTEIEVPLNNNNNNKVRPILPQSVTQQSPVQKSATNLSLNPSNDVTHLLRREPGGQPLTSQVLLPNLADHMDMARPPHENPEYLLQTGFSVNSRPLPHPVVPEAFRQQQQQQQQQQTFSTVQTVQAAVPIAIPVTNFAFSSANSPVTIHLNHNLHFFGVQVSLVICEKYEPKNASM